MSYIKLDREREGWGLLELGRRDDGEIRALGRNSSESVRLKRANPTIFKILNLEGRFLRCFLFSGERIEYLTNTNTATPPMN